MQLPVLSDADVLPPLYSRWFGEFLPGPIPRETNATCDDCAMCLPEGERPVGRQLAFDPDVKCCTFTPVLHNYLAGFLLTDDDPSLDAGRASVLRRVESGENVTPLGIGRSPRDQMALEHAGPSDAFGRHPDLRCPHYLLESGMCGIWKYREATCATWFCKHLRGSVGFRFWRRSLQLISAIENQLSAWCMVELEPGETSIVRTFAPIEGQAVRSDVFSEGAFDGRPSEAAQRANWGAWHGREREYFERCASLVAELSWSDVRDIGGLNMSICERLVRDGYRDLVTESLPDRLRLADMHVLGSSDAAVRLVTYSKFDPLDVPRPVVDALHYFDGRPTGEAIGAAEKQVGQELDPLVFVRLADFGILEDVSEPEPAPPRL